MKLFLRVIAYISLVVIFSGSFFIIFRYINNDFFYSLKKKDLIKVGTVNDGFNSLLYIADDRDFFSEQGIDVVFYIFNSDDMAIKYLNEKKVDVISSKGIDFANSIVSNKQLMTFGTISKARTGQIITKTSSKINQLGDLVGKKVGLPSNKHTEYYLDEILAIEGINSDNITKEQIDLQEIDKSFNKSDVDAIYAEYISIYKLLEKIETKDIIYQGSLPQKINYYLLTQKNQNQVNEVRLQKFLAALIQAEDYISKNPKQSKEIISRITTLDSKYIDYIWERTDFSVNLDQSMVITLEDQIQWILMKNKQKDKIPNVLPHFNTNLLYNLKPQSVNITK